MKAKQVFKKHNLPDVIHWAFSGRCNLNCSFCYGPFMKGKLSLCDKEKILTKIIKAKIPQVTITGGEPLLDQDVYKIIKQASDAGIYTSLHTNALLLNDKARGSLKDHLSRLSLALDGSDRLLNTTMRGSENYFDSVLSALTWARKINLPVTIKTVLTKKNYKDFPKLKKLIECELNYNTANLWYVSEFLPIRNGALTQKEYEITREQFVRVRKALFKADVRNVVRSKEDIERFPYFYVGSTGEVFTWDKQHLKDQFLGNLLELSIAEAWKRIQKVNLLTRESVFNEHA